MNGDTDGFCLEEGGGGGGWKKGQIEAIWGRRFCEGIMGAAASAEGDSEHKTDSVESKDAKQPSTIGVYIPSFFLNS